MNFDITDKATKKDWIIATIFYSIMFWLINR